METLNNILQWLIKNKEWLLSGVGVTIIGYITKRFFGKSDKKNGNGNEITIGKHSYIGGDIVGNNKNSFEKLDKESQNIIRIASESIIGGSVIGGDLNIIAEQTIKTKLDELIAIFDFKAQQIRTELRYKYVPSTQFDTLHDQHINAIKKNDFILAHTILLEIHKLITTLCEKSSESNTPVKLDPDVCYNIRLSRLRPSLYTQLNTLPQNPKEYKNYLLGIISQIEKSKI